MDRLLDRGRVGVLTVDHVGQVLRMADQVVGQGTAAAQERQQAPTPRPGVPHDGQHRLVGPGPVGRGGARIEQADQTQQGGVRVGHPGEVGQQCRHVEPGPGPSDDLGEQPPDRRVSATPARASSAAVTCPSSSPGGPPRRRTGPDLTGGAGSGRARSG
ncbi:hypothetical protein BJF81_13745 [Ornithinimicrobium sp. CNJ-824]|uniref:hypothetical protein n=1 Tax=Ornithinimicrobium sp. CNJ-824 TaxID=1904966 RepID=UPI00095DB46C|nr:hypothetical protein [Ornithinimicrobium sp. CNJ-824]OLT22029.1 hypothetical protein BJF81_13745 [Ornithinimicrobium sp. CNJ-824]